MIIEQKCFKSDLLALIFAAINKPLFAFFFLQFFNQLLYMRVESYRWCGKNLSITIFR